MDIAVTKMSSKGQIVIPVEMRKGIKEGDKLILMRKGDRLVLKRATRLDKKFLDDIEFARRTEEAWKKFDRGEFIEMDLEEFLKEMKRW
jgi:AbrB family looped-hinge helix DNA binding protein